MIATRVGIVVYDSFVLSQAATLVDILQFAAGLDSRAYGMSLYECTMLSARGGAVASAGGVSVNTAALAEADDLDHVVVCGGTAFAAAIDDGEIGRFLLARAPRLRTLSAIASGSLLLASTGLLDGRRATTHWMCRYELAARYPAVQDIHSRSFVVDGPFMTCSATGAAMPLAQALIAHDHGEDVARRALHYFQPSHGDGAPGAVVATEDPPEDRFIALLEWAEQNLHRPLTINYLAERAGMSPTHFVAAFSAAMGATPAKAIERLRVEAAVMLFKSGEASASRVAKQVGFMQTRRMRHAFLRVLGKSPQAARDAVQADRPSRASAPAS